MSKYYMKKKTNKLIYNKISKNIGVSWLTSRSPIFDKKGDKNNGQQGKWTKIFKIW